MKIQMTSLLMLVLPVAVFAQNAPVADGKVTHPQASHMKAKTKANAMPSKATTPEISASPSELAIAERVYQGKLPCELGAFVNLQADGKAPGFFDVQLGANKFRMFPVETTTGAIRLEDKQAGAVWLQLANKSMLMSQKLGKRLADECVSPAQTLVALSLIKNPAPSVLETPRSIAIK
jgi:hypothetical protein